MKCEVLAWRKVEIWHVQSATRSGDLLNDILPLPLDGLIHNLGPVGTSMNEEPFQGITYTSTWKI